MASRSRTIYIGFTSALEKRVQQHKTDTYDGFSRQYQCHRLIHMEAFQDVHQAISREKQLKHWSRSKKLTLIERANPAWYDLSEDWGKPIEPFQDPPGLSTSVRRTFGRDDIHSDKSGTVTVP